MSLFLQMTFIQAYNLIFIGKDNKPIADLGIAFSSREGAACYASDNNGTIIVP